MSDFVQLRYKKIGEDLGIVTWMHFFPEELPEDVLNTSYSVPKNTVPEIPESNDEFLATWELRIKPSTMEMWYEKVPVKPNPEQQKLLDLESENNLLKQALDDILLNGGAL